MSPTVFTGKTCVVTGAGSGIGRALAENLAGRGARLALSDIDGSTLAETARRCESHGAYVSTALLDVSDRDAVSRYAEEVVAEFGIVHQVYNNAGIAYFGSVLESDFADMERVLAVDYWGVVHGTKAFLPHLVASGDGHVVNISSLFGLLSLGGQSAYNSAKFAVRGFTEALRQEMIAERLPVRVTCVHPGGIRTAVARNATTARGIDAASVAEIFDRRLAFHSPEMAARAIVAGVRRRRARVVIGWEAKGLDMFQRVTGAGYQRVLAVTNPFTVAADRNRK
ncbi:acetoin dehydrogenase [Rhodococcus ruber Chol-4]|uniref:Putative oxidoreductase SadH n=1 Tax=Rhodococcus ruber TaxID=1830 RepID=A0A098BPE0_9NOCA|nr:MULTISPECIES: SDR family NAD(P)-dependent oxidoreductase [Rhodococcus]RIK13974.1 MAG: KR domain-containing protein [Acidobacteriota bacterium]KXF86079.1 acetoin dehydrogenase [Rhodococcus ruber Chol-4]MBP2209790.1 short-subunit dehydrogenase [Rhodococcus ruber]MCD2127552.1 SDR family NAD(P)-dependent oxidoreductase [Rhodococcus ruber]MCZ4504158.1 SDR family NAD(P)-dependent oxidoreductase [Rhodococcus ruber]